MFFVLVVVLLFTAKIGLVRVGVPEDCIASLEETAHLHVTDEDLAVSLDVSNGDLSKAGEIELLVQVLVAVEVVGERATQCKAVPIKSRVLVVFGLSDHGDDRELGHLRDELREWGAGLHHKDGGTTAIALVVVKRTVDQSVRRACRCRVLHIELDRVAEHEDLNKILKKSVKVKRTSSNSNSSCFFFEYSRRSLSVSLYMRPKLGVCSGLLFNNKRILFSFIYFWYFICTCASRR